MPNRCSHIENKPNSVEQYEKELKKLKVLDEAQGNKHTAKIKKI